MLRTGKGMSFVALVVLLGTLLVAPAASAEPGQLDDPVPPSCPGLTSQLQGQVNKAKSALTAIPPDPTGATGALGGGLPVVNSLQGAGCLPAIPPAAGAPVPPCAEPTAALLANLFKALSSLLKVGAPDVTGAVTAVTDLVTTITGLISGKCLPAPVPPPAP